MEFDQVMAEDTELIQDLRKKSRETKPSEEEVLTKLLGLVCHKLCEFRGEVCCYACPFSDYCNVSCLSVDECMTGYEVKKFVEEYRQKKREVRVCNSS